MKTGKLEEAIVLLKELKEYHKVWMTTQDVLDFLKSKTENNEIIRSVIILWIDDILKRVEA